LKFAFSATILLAFITLSATAKALPSAADGVRVDEVRDDDLREVASASPTAVPAVSSTTAPAPALAPLTATLLPAAPLPPIEFAPAMANAFVILKTPPQPHKFLDARNSLGLASMATSLIADALSTQKGLAYPSFHEMNPIARPFVQTRAGAAAYSAGSFALLAGAMYTAHKTHHHKLEYIFPFAIAGWEAALSARNYHVIATRPR
jgi:hypothetical protein